MISRIKSLFLGKIPAPEPTTSQRDDISAAAAALLVEAAMMDGEFDDAERATVGNALVRRFGLDAAEVGAVIDDAIAAVESSNKVFSATQVIKESFEYNERVGMIELLWEVAYADGELHDYEANLVRRVTGLLYIQDADSGLARKRVMARLGA
jgi:uncharacterized tellurite resistance protein B-like protein